MRVGRHPYVASLYLIIHNTSGPVEVEKGWSAQGRCKRVHGECKRSLPQCNTRAVVCGGLVYGLPESQFLTWALQAIIVPQTTELMNCAFATLGI